MNALGVGGTPLLDLSHLVTRGRLLMKAEFRNPFGSAKDRTACYLLAWARGIGGPGVQMVESTSGNLGIALAALGRVLGFQPIVIVDTTVSERQRQRIIDAGARLELVRKPRPGCDMRQTRIALASELGAREGHIWLNQYGNDAGLRAHRETTGPEIWAQSGGLIDTVVAPVSTGGTICGVGQWLKTLRADLQVVGVEPEGSSIFGGHYEPSFLIAGAGMRGPCLLTVAHGSVIDRYAKVADSVSAAYAVHLRQECGLPVGLSTGAALSVAIQLAEEENRSVVVVAPDTSVGFRAEIDAMAGRTPDTRALPRAALATTADIAWGALYEKENAT